MRGDGSDTLRDGALLSSALKRLRRRSGLSKAEIATAMNLSLRTYERFEAGETRLNLDYVERFSQATGSDPHAILLAVATGSPELAVRCADNRFATILVIALRRFDDSVGDRLATFEVRTLIAAVTAMFDGLAATPSPDDPTRSWLEQGQDELGTHRPRPGR